MRSVAITTAPYYGFDDVHYNEASEATRTTLRRLNMIANSERWWSFELAKHPGRWHGFGSISRRCAFG